MLSEEVLSVCRDKRHKVNMVLNVHRNHEAY